MRLTGTLEDIIYQSAESHYLVGVMDYEGDPLTIVGHGYGLKVGDSLILEGEYVFHEVYGEQFKFTTYQVALPEDHESMLRFLSSGAIKGIGPATAEKILDVFGLDTLDVMNYNPEALLQIQGIGKSKLKDITTSYQEVVGHTQAMMFLQSLKLGPSLISRIIKKYGHRTRETVTGNPYRLYEDIEGISFKRADEIAEILGVERDSRFRIMSFVRFHLEAAAKEGHTFIAYESALEDLKGSLGIDMDLLKEQVREMILKGQLYIKEDRLYLASLYLAEAQSSGRLMAIHACEAVKVVNDSLVQELLDRFQQEEHILLNPLQQEAIRSGIKNKVTVITGGPGTGKTTIVKGILYITDRFDLKVHLGAPTGRAAKRLKEATGEEAKTIHRLLEYQYQEESALLLFNRNEENPLEGDLVIIDEFSMVDIHLLKHLLQGISLESRLIFIGDVDQLPAVGPGNVLEDIIASGYFNTVRLKEIYRQGSNSTIALSAHEINQGRMPLENHRDGDFFHIASTNQERILSQVVSLLTHRLKEYYGMDPLLDIQVITPMKNGILGTHHLNEVLQEALNPPGDQEQMRFGNKLFRQGDKVMQFKNNYNLAYLDTETHLEGKGLFNGELGIVRQVSQTSGRMVVLFDGYKEVVFEPGDLGDLDLAYAITIHKSQGSEFRGVVIPLSYLPPQMISRNLIYTAVTRGRDLVIIVGDRGVLNMMVRDEHRPRRNSGLIYQLRAFEALET
ncbi:MAG: hypothetical protein AVO33_07745 [delta proteobacterium ML8_F1]|nr:MAG: hypothetical protein AVO33_07745 [delta proteobacterium ML8_F1]